MNPDGRRCQDLWVIAVNYHGFNVHLRQHPNQKPDELMERLVLLLSNEDTIIFDPFLGSGTTMVAAQRLGRVCRGIEIEPSYVAVTLERMKGLGLDPVLVKEPAS
jgi:DNA modification methylase